MGLWWPGKKNVGGESGTALMAFIGVETIYSTDYEFALLFQIVLHRGRMISVLQIVIRYIHMPY